MNNPVDQPKVSEMRARLTELAAQAYDDTLDGKGPNLNPFEAIADAYLAALIGIPGAEKGEAVAFIIHDDPELGDYLTKSRAAADRSGLPVTPLYAAPTSERVQAWTDVAAERERQKAVEGWTPDHDDEHASGQLADAAACYAFYDETDERPIRTSREVGLSQRTIARAHLWPWEHKWWKPSGRRRNLVKAGALILAEIERLDRAALKATP